jgi:hypothetical protein
VRDIALIVPISAWRLSECRFLTHEQHTLDDPVDLELVGKDVL